MGFLTNKRILITGLASNRSIAYGMPPAMEILEVLSLRFSYLNDKLKPRVEFAKEFGSEIVLPLDVATDESISECFAELSKHWDKIVVFRTRYRLCASDQLDGDYVNARYPQKVSYCS